MTGLNLTDVRSRLHLKSAAETQLLEIEIFVLVSFFLLLILLPTRHFRRHQYKSSLFKTLDVCGSTALFLLIPFIFGIMLSFDAKHEFVPIWATFLMFIFFTVPDTLNLSGGGLTRAATCAKFLLYFLYIGVLIGKLQFSKFIIPLSFLIMLSYQKLFEKWPGLDSPFADTRRFPLLYHYISKSLLDGDASPSNQDPFLRCKYGVDGDNNIIVFDITVSTVWGCEDQQLNNGIKNTCLSFALYNILLQKYSCVLSSCQRSEPNEEWEFVVNGVLNVASPFKIIEEELRFLGDFFFAKYCVTAYDESTVQLCIYPFFFLGAMSWIVILISESYDPRDVTAKIQYHGHDIDLAVTVIAIISVTLLILVRILGFCGSRWARVKLICRYIRRKSWQKKGIWDCCIWIAARIHCRFPHYQLNELWKRKIGQYSLLHSCTHYQSFWWRFFSFRLYKYTGITYGRVGRKEGDAKTISSEIETRVIRCLQSNGPELTNGTRAMFTQGWMLHSLKLDTHANVILAWHIATSICEISPQLPSSDCSSSDFRVATTLSKYCAYLVSFSPELLPGHPELTHYVCTTVIREMYTVLSDSESSDMYAKLMDIGNLESDDPVEAFTNNASILQCGVHIGKILEGEDLADIRWKLLADFWTEMVLFLAPNANNHLVHAQGLVDGGEFITVLWALLFHAGIANRDKLDKRASDASTETASASLPV